MCLLLDGSMFSKHIVWMLKTLQKLLCTLHCVNPIRSFVRSFARNQARGDRQEKKETSNHTIWAKTNLSCVFTCVTKYCNIVLNGMESFWIFASLTFGPTATVLWFSHASTIENYNNHHGYVCGFHADAKHLGTLWTTLYLSLSFSHSVNRKYPFFVKTKKSSGKFLLHLTDDVHVCWPHLANLMDYSATMLQVLSCFQQIPDNL